jgi:RNase P/RNase MRP subunit POP5
MFRTTLEITPQPYAIGHCSSLALLGSCFSEKIGAKLIEHKFDALINPFGTLFHPRSICQLITKSIKKEPLNADSMLLHDERYLSHELHSSLNAASREELQHLFSNQSRILSGTLSKANFLIITMGTALEYIHKETGQHVANCHKVPQKHFNRKLTSLDALHDSFAEAHQILQELNPQIEILLTVSPVRHTKDSIELNSVSKASLRLACADWSRDYDNVHYFPSYEIMMDDLRDYRYYEKDLVHPNEQAIDYIWNQFSQTFFVPKTKELNTKIQKINRAIAHRAFNPNSKAHQKFLKQTLSDMEELNEVVSFQREIDSLKSQIIYD